MSIPASIRRRYLSKFLAILLIVAGMQSSLPANAAFYHHENPPTQSEAIASLDSCVAAINSSRFTRATLPNLLFFTNETALVNAITDGLVKVTVLTTSTLFEPHTGRTDLICGNHLDNNVGTMDSYNPGTGDSSWESNTGAGPYATMTKRGRDFFFGGAGNDTVNTLYESFFWGGPGTDSQGPGWPNLGTTSRDTVQRTGTFNEGGEFFEQGAELPGAPTIGTATLASSTSVTVSFTAPGSNGGSAITSYTAVSTPGSITASVNQSGSGSITVTGLSANTAYTFKVYASNIEGAGASSSSSASVSTPQSVACSGGGTFTIQNNVVTNSDLTCAGAVVIPDGVTSIAANAFSRYSKTTQEQQRITSVTIPNSVITIYAGAFQDNRNVSSLTIGTAVTSIGNDAFNNLYGLTTLVIPGSVTTIGIRAFANVNLTSLTLNEGLVTIGSSAFLGNKLVTLVIPNSVTTISTEAAFAGWGLIETLTLGSGLTTIGNRTFEDAKPQSLTIPPGVTTLGTNAFRDYAQSTYTYCGTSLTQSDLNSAGLTGKTKTCPVAQTITRTSTSPTSPVKSGTYTPTATASSGLTVAISIAAGSSSVCSISGVTVTFNTVGSCVIQYNQPGNSSYSAATQVTETLTIGKATPTFSTWSGVLKNYGDSAFTVAAPSVTGSIPGSFSYSSATTSVISVSGTTLTVAGAGTSVITATFTPDDSTNYNSATINMTVTVGKANQATLSVANQNFWAHQNQFPSSWLPTGGSGTGALEYSVTSGPCTISSGTLYGNPTGPNGPTVCTLTVTKLADTNYNAITSASFTATMAFSFSRVGLALPSAATTATYGTPVVITATSFGQIPGTISFRAAGQEISGCTNKSVTALPWTTTCTWTPSASGTTNLTYDWVPSEPNLYGTKTNWIPYKLSTDSLGSTTPVTITVAKIATTNSLALSSATSTYGSINTITATVSAPGTVAFKSSGTDISGCASVATTLASPYTAACPWIPTGVASYSLTAVLTPTDTAAYATATSTALTPTSVKSPITITPTPGLTKVFGTQNPPLTYSISSGALVLSDTLSGELSYVGSDAGSYTINLGTLTNANNPKYEITLASETFTITKALQSAVSLLSLSSAFNPSNKTVTLTGSGGTSTGSYQYALDSSNSTSGCSVNGSTLTYTTAGTCLIGVTRTSDTNYLSRTDVVSFSIGIASQTITFGSLSAKNYSAETFTVSATSSASLTVVFTSASQSVCTTSGTSGSIISLLGVGTCVINANQIGDANVSPASEVSQIFTVNPRAITVTADAKTKVYGAADPTFTYSITTGSLVLGDAITGALTRAVGTDVGVYQIQQGALTTANNPKYAITFVAADLTITRATPTLVLTYPNSNVAILRPGAVNTPIVTTSSSSGALTFATSAASSICTVDTTTGVISLFGAGSCPVAMTTAITTNFIQDTETTTVTVALISTSLEGINQSDLVSMGQPFFAHASVDQAYSFSSGNNGASVAIPAGALDPLVPISIHLLTDSADQREMIGGTGTSVLSVVVSWVAPDGSVPNTNTGKAISVTLTNPDIKKDAKIYSIIGNQSRLLGTATADGSVTTLITEDPVLLVINPVVTTPVPSTSSGGGGGGGGGGYVAPTPEPTPTVDPAVAAAAAAKALAEKAATEAKLAAEAKAVADAKAAADKKAAEEAELLATLKSAQEKADAEALAAAKKVADELAAAQLKIEEELKAAAALKLAEEQRIAAERAVAAKRITTVYSTSAAFKLNSTYTNRLKTNTTTIAAGSTVTCIGYAKSSKTLTYAKAKVVATKQAKALCSSMKKINPTLKTKSTVLPASKAPKTTVNKKWIPVSYRVETAIN
jgi:hypothetical protein